jgi:hypothetical protein
MKPGDLEEMSVSRILRFVQSVQLLNAWTLGLHKRSSMAEVHGSLLCLSFYSILFYSIL